MKKLAYILVVAAIGLILASCEPTLLEKPEIGAPPQASDALFSITPGTDVFHFVLENTSTATGIANWEFGNGNTASGDKVVAYYPLPGTYTIKMTLYGRGGHASTAKDHITTETDWALFSNPLNDLVCGGPEAVNGKTWVMDSLTKAHLGVGPDLTKSSMWWSAGSLEKSATGLYDDEINFSLQAFKVTYDNKGLSYVKSFRKDDGAYSNARANKGDFTVSYQTPVTGTWAVVEKDGKNYLTITSSKPLYPCFDTGAKDGEYLILNITETSLELACIGGDNNAWHYLLKLKGS
jgi:hypothetical protein